MTRLLALLRAVNVGGRKLPMAELRDLCATLGWTDVLTYIQSGNVVFTANANAQAAEADLEQAIEQEFGLDVPVVVRSAAQWTKLVDSNPFGKAAQEEPNRLQLLVSKRPPAADAAQKLMERALAGEQVEAVPGGLWFHFPEGVARSKLTPSLIDKACGSPATGRNYRTVQRLRDMLESC
jgi:uncharacterized protein (DUF1697 family)